MKQVILSGLFCLLLLAGTVAHLLLPDKYFSQQEKRTLAQCPDISWASFSSGKFGTELETYLADQFPLRDGWVTVKTLVDLLSGKRESGGVYFAGNDYLIEVHSEFDQEQLTQNLEALKALQELLDRDGVTMRVMLVPTAGWILSKKLPAFAPNADQQAVMDQASQIGLRLTDVTPALREHMDEYVFYKTDHHWTSLGAYYAWAAWMEARGITPPPLSDWTKEVLTDQFRGTTYAKVNAPFAPYDTIDGYYRRITRHVSYNGGSSVTDSIFERRYLEGADQYAVFFNSNQADTVVEGDGEGRLLILKDSYANCFAQFCVDDFAQTHLIDLRFFRGSVQKYIQEHDITEVLVLYNVPNFAADTAVSRCAR